MQHFYLNCLIFLKKGGFSLSTSQVDRRIRRSKRLLQQSLLDLMIHCDLEDITVTDIVNHADYNRSTFYRHYDHKEQIADEIITDQLNKLIRNDFISDMFL